MMSKIRRFKDKDNPNHILHIDSINATRMKMPKYNPYQIGHGVIGDVRYNRNRQKRANKKFISEWDDID